MHDVPERIVNTARDIIKSGNVALVLFTEGANFKVLEDGTGHSGSWYIQAPPQYDQVIVYYRQGGVLNQILSANVVRLEAGDEPHHYWVYFRDAEWLGYSTSFWPQFGNDTRNPAITIVGQ